MEEIENINDEIEMMGTDDETSSHEVSHHDDSLPHTDVSNKTVMPVEISVQIGRMVIDAQQASSLSSGDVLDVTCASPSEVSLLCCGREIGKGKLVDIDGHLGVKITKNWGY